MKKLLLMILLIIIMLLGVSAADYSAAWPSSSVNSQYNYNNGFMNHVTCLGDGASVNLQIIEESGTKYINIEGAEFALTSSDKSYVDSSDVKSIKDWFNFDVYFWIYQTGNSIEVGCTSKDYNSITMASGAEFTLQNRISGGVENNRYDLPFIVRDLNDASKTVDQTGLKTVEILPVGTTEESLNENADSTEQTPSVPTPQEPTTPVQEESPNDEESEQVGESSSEDPVTPPAEENVVVPVKEDPVTPPAEENVVVPVKEDPVTPPAEESETVVVTQASDEPTSQDEETTDQEEVQNDQDTTPEQEVEPVVTSAETVTEETKGNETEGKGVIAFVEDNFGGIIKHLPGEKTETKAYIFLAIVAVAAYLFLFRK